MNSWPLRFWIPSEGPPTAAPHRLRHHRQRVKEVSRSYKEARTALDVGKIFFSDRDVFAYSALGIGRLIYQLPIPLCKLFIKEIFADKSPDDFDEETLVTINKFFENSLNVSETSRQLYIHRNTLVDRLDKLQKSTGWICVSSRMPLLQDRADGRTLYAVHGNFGLLVRVSAHSNSRRSL